MAHDKISLSPAAKSISRRKFLQNTALASLAHIPVLHSMAESHAATYGPARRVLSLDENWLFGGKQNSAADNADTSFTHITLPHTVTQLSWQKWDPQTWEDVWTYRRRFDLPSAFQGLRLFLHFDRVMSGATVAINGHTFPEHLGGFLPFDYEITSLVHERDNLLTVAVDARWLNAPPSGSPKGPASVDYMLPGGITGSVSLYAVPAVFIENVFAKPVRVLEADRHIEIRCTVASSQTHPSSIRLEAKLQTGAHTIAQTAHQASLENPQQEFRFNLEHLGNVTLWDTDNPLLYNLSVTLWVDGHALHSSTTRIGLREASFTQQGFFLNGRRLRLFGLNRHELYPYFGFAAPRRALRRDAEILRKEFNCNIVRCSHYPQSEAFLDACDELGLLVWEEIPGWQYLGDENWQQLAVRDVEAMVRRDRSHPSIVIWGTRINESANEQPLYRRTREAADALDGSRPTSGSMTSASRKNWQQEWHQDVFAFDDYHADATGNVGIDEPLPGVPYMLAEAVGQFNYGEKKGFNQKYRRAGDVAMQSRQALLHAQAHNKAASFPRCSGVIAWCAFDYASLINSYDGVKCPGVADSFRIPKPGAAFYRSQLSPHIKPVIEPSFYWDFGPATPQGPGQQAAIFSNCDKLELWIDNKLHATLHPDRDTFPNLEYPPFFADLETNSANAPELHIHGFVDNKLVLSRLFSSDSTADKLWLETETTTLRADGEDAARLAFGVVDKFGNPRLHAGGTISFAIQGPGTIAGDNPFHLEDSGGVGAVWLRTIPGRAGHIQVEVTHSALGKRTAEVRSA